MNTNHQDRRSHARLEIARPCKVYLRGAGRYAAARTHDVSVGGALLDVQLDRTLGVGDTLDIGVAWTQSAVLKSEQLVPCRVVRVRDNSDRKTQTIAVTFVSRPVMAAAA